HRNCPRSGCRSGRVSEPPSAKTKAGGRTPSEQLWTLAYTCSPLSVLLPPLRSFGRAQHPSRASSRNPRTRRPSAVSGLRKDPMPAPVVSVVIAAKNAEATIGGSLTSLVNQNFDAGDLEVIVVNDGSTDDTAGVVGEFSDRLTLIEIDSPVSRAASAARNTALEASTAQTITYLDADDGYAPGHLHSLTAALTGRGVDFAKPHALSVNGFNRTPRRPPCAQHNPALDPRDFILPHDASPMVDCAECWPGIYSRSMAE